MRSVSGFILAAGVVWAASTLAMGQASVFRPAAPAPPGPAGYRLLGGRWVRPAGAFRFSEIVRVALDGPRLTFAFAPTPAWQPKLIYGRHVAAELDDDRAGPLWSLLRTRPAWHAPFEARGDTIVLLSTVPAAPPPDPTGASDGPLRVTALTVAPGGVIVRGLGRADGLPVAIEYASARDGTRPRLTVVFTDNRRGFDLTGEHLIDLLNQRPGEVRRFLGPLLTQLADANLLRPRPGDVYRAFDHLEPAPEQRARFAAIVARLDALDRADRDRAEAELDAMGPPAVLAALRIDPADAAGLSPEQAARLDAFIARNSLGDIDPAAARVDPLFPRAALHDPDPRVRAAAREQLDAAAD